MKKKTIPEWSDPYKLVTTRVDDWDLFEKGQEQGNKLTNYPVPANALYEYLQGICIGMEISFHESIGVLQALSWQLEAILRQAREPRKVYKQRKKQGGGGSENRAKH